MFSIALRCPLFFFCVRFRAVWGGTGETGQDGEGGFDKRRFRSGRAGGKSCERGKQEVLRLWEREVVKSRRSLFVLFVDFMGIYVYMKSFFFFFVRRKKRRQRQMQTQR